jgi:hypothetical protein
VTFASDDQPRAHGLSGDHGWNDQDEAPLGGLRSMLFVAAGTAYFGSVWLLSGLAPLPLLISRLRGDRRASGRLDADEVPTSSKSWRKTAA